MQNCMGGNHADAMMSIEGARLSLRAGVLIAATSDEALLDAVRRISESLTPEHLVIIESFALLLGTPERVVAAAVQKGKALAANEAFMRYGMALQRAAEGVQ
jgi:chaperone required for assembly of F1-ATPase